MGRREVQNDSEVLRGLGLDVGVIVSGVVVDHDVQTPNVHYGCGKRVSLSSAVLSSSDFGARSTDAPSIAEAKWKSS